MASRDAEHTGTPGTFPTFVDGERRKWFQQPWSAALLIYCGVISGMKVNGVLDFIVAFSNISQHYTVRC